MSRSMMTVSIFLSILIFAACRERIKESKLVDMDTPQSSASAAPGEGVFAQTSRGVVFKRDTSHPGLGMAWVDPDGTIWGDVAKNEDATVLLQNFRDATKYCQEHGGRLPTELEFARMRVYMGVPQDWPLERDHPDYVPEMPALFYKVGAKWAPIFWTSTLAESNFAIERVFNTSAEVPKATFARVFNAKIQVGDFFSVKLSDQPGVRPEDPLTKIDDKATYQVLCVAGG